MDCISMFVHIMKENDSRVTLWKERLHLNGDRQQFHEYLQNEQIIEHTHPYTHTHTHTRFGTGANTLVNNVVATSYNLKCEKKTYVYHWFVSLIWCLMFAIGYFDH